MRVGEGSRVGHRDESERGSGSDSGSERRYMSRSLVEKRGLRLRRKRGTDPVVCSALFPAALPCITRLCCPHHVCACGAEQAQPAVLER